MRWRWGGIQLLCIGRCCLIKQVIHILTTGYHILTTGYFFMLNSDLFGHKIDKAILFKEVKRQCGNGNLQQICFLRRNLRHYGHQCSHKNFRHQSATLSPTDMIVST